MRLDRVKTPEQLARFLKADHYWYTGFGGATLSEPCDGFTFLVRVSKDGTVDAMVKADHQHVAPPTDLATAPSETDGFRQGGEADD